MAHGAANSTVKGDEETKWSDLNSEGAGGFLPTVSPSLWQAEAGPLHWRRTGRPPATATQWQAASEWPSHRHSAISTAQCCSAEHSASMPLGVTRACHSVTLALWHCDSDSRGGVGPGPSIRGAAGPGTRTLAGRRATRRASAGAPELGTCQHWPALAPGGSPPGPPSSGRSGGASRPPA